MAEFGQTMCPFGCASIVSVFECILTWGSW